MNWLSARLYRWRIPLSAALVLGAAMLSPRATHTDVDNDISAWFSRDDPLYRDYDRFRLEFGGTQPLIIAIRSETPDPDAPAAGLFTRRRLEFLKAITEELGRISSVQRVQSLATANVLRAQPAGGPGEESGSALAVGPLLDLSRRSPEEIRSLSVNDPLFRRELVSDDGTVAALIVTFDEDRLDEDRAGILNEIYTRVHARLPPGISTYYNGSIQISETYNRVTAENQRRFIPPILALTLLAVYALFRSIARAVIAMGAIIVSVLWTLGLYAYMGFGFNILTAMLTPLVVVLAISDDVHLIQQFDEERRRGDAEHAFTATVSYLFAPLFAASGTTALGLLSLATSDIVAVRQFGVGAAAGVMIDFVISIVLVPTCLTFVRPAARIAPHDHFTHPLQRVAAFATRRPRLVLVTSLAVAFVAVGGMTRLRVDTNHINFFAATHPLSRSAAVIDDQLAGVYSFHVLVEGAPESMAAPDTVRRIGELAAAIAALPNVRKATSMADHVKRTNQELHDGDPAAAVVSRDSTVIAQELLVFTLDDDGRRELERVVSPDFSAAQIAVRLPSMGSDVVFETIQRSQRLASDMFAGTSLTATVTGSGRLFSALDHYLVRSQISSFTTAFLTIFVAMFVIFRSTRFGLLALVPNVLPVLGVLGVMGWFDISLNVATVMVASVALGVVDDDTVHFLHRFRHHVALGVGADDAVQAAVATEGRAALTTALISSSGFAVLMLSEYKPSAWFGGLLALTLGVAFVVEVLILPAIIKVLARVLGSVPERVGGGGPP